jgi:predicted O-methyltransferase YrrM
MTPIERRLRELPVVRDLVAGRRLARAHRSTGYVMRHPPGHYASPIPALNEIRAREDEIFDRPETIPAIDVRSAAQLALVREFAPLYADQPFGAEARDGLRYHLKNQWFSYSDGLMLHCMLRWLAPKRLIEVGSGYSSAAILDTNDRFLDGRMACTFIEPNASRLHGLLRDGDARDHRVIEQPVQRVPLEVFDELDAGDVLFVDSSHVSKAGSDVNRLVFDVLPRLRPGVVVHFHDIAWPFEYPRQWIYGGRAFNEAYLLHAFLMFNPDFEIVLFNSYLAEFHRDEVAHSLPLWAEEVGGSLWLRRTGNADS